MPGFAFSYDNDREILSGVNMTFKRGAFTAIVGESGCGKSTISAILTGRNKGYGGSVSVGETELSEIREADLMENITYISHQSYLFKERYGIICSWENRMHRTANCGKCLKE